MPGKCMETLMYEWGDFSYLWVSYCRKHYIKLLIKRIYGLTEDVGWRIPRWLLSAWSSLMCEWDDFSYFWVFILLKDFHKDSDQENIWFGRRCWLRNSKMAVKCIAIFDVWMGWLLLFQCSHYVGGLSQVLAQENIWFGRRWWLKNSKMAV